MVHENGLQTNLSQEGVVNSSSLEDVQLNEPIENRAQSIQSLHSSVETLTPTPDAVPSYDELQQRLDEYNRHIAQMNEQKNQLQRMHSDAKRHLMLLEQYQRECAERNLSFDDKTKNGENGGEHGGQPPDYDSVDEVQSDMAILAQRVQNISRIVDNQKKLVNQLPDEASEDLRANQADLERKLKDLKRNGNDLHLLAAELDTMNTAVATTAAKVEESSTPTTAATENGMRVVPIRVTAASARNQSPAKSIDENDTPAAPPGTLKSIDQKEAEIEIMRAQLQRLKLMMGTIETMESRTQPLMQLDALIDRDRTPTPASAAAAATAAAGSNRARNLRILDNVSSDLRAESERNEVAQERIMSLQDHISRCSKQAAAAIQLGDDALKRHSATPTPTPASLRSQRSITPDAVDASSSSQTASELEREYRAKKQQFEEICRKMNANDNNEQQQQTAPAATTTKKCQNAPTKTELVNSSSSSSLAEHAPAAQLETTAAPATPAAAALSGGAANVHHVSDGLSFDASSLGGGSTLNSFSLPAALNLNANNNNNNNGGGISWPPGTSSWSLPNFRSPLISMPQNIQLPNFVPQSPLSMPFNAATSAATTNGMPPTAAGATSGWENSTLVQHCLQQQQIFGQALNQLYTIIWQQQREIEHLHRGIVVLQERVLRLSDDVPLSMPAELGLDMNFRAESVPPTFNMSLGGGVSGAGGIPLPPYLNMTNNNGLDMNRAQSEQPQPLQHQHAHNQQHYHHLQQQQQQQQRQLNMNNLGATSVGVNGAGIFSSELHHHQQQQQQQTTQTASSVVGGGGSTRIYATLNNANVSGPQQHQSYRQQSLDTSTKTSQQHQQEVSGGIGAAPPIFMHHHNNAIHQNNANLRRANLRSNIAAAAAADANNSTLNNQVPPGNRTNNYWDNFRR